jgi:hypothetical protein
MLNDDLKWMSINRILLTIIQFLLGEADFMGISEKLKNNKNPDDLFCLKNFY